MKSFDRFIAEMKRETIPFRAFGEVYEIPRRIPAMLMLELSRCDADGEVPLELMCEAARQIFGAETLAALAKHEEFSLELLGEMLKWAFQAINGAPEAAELTEDGEEAGGGKN